MSLTPQEARARKSARRPIFGWVRLEDGLYAAPDNFAQEKLFATRWFRDFAERTRARHSIFEYAGTVLRQRRRERGGTDPDQEN